MPDDTPRTEADVALIQRILPHRYPFLLIDKVVEITEKSAIGIKNVSINEPQFQGHFPERAIMPGVTIIEAMGQTAGVMIGVSQNLVGTGLLIYFMGIEKARFRRMVVPGDVLKLHVTALRVGSKILRFQGRAEVEGELAAEAEFMAMVDRKAAE